MWSVDRGQYFTFRNKEIAVILFLKYGDRLID